MVGKEVHRTSKVAAIAAFIAMSAAFVSALADESTSDRCPADPVTRSISGVSSEEQLTI